MVAAYLNPGASETAAPYYCSQFNRTDLLSQDAPRALNLWIWMETVCGHRELRRGRRLDGGKVGSWGGFVRLYFSPPDLERWTTLNYWKASVKDGVRVDRRRRGRSHGCHYRLKESPVSVPYSGGSDARDAQWTYIPISSSIEERRAAPSRRTTLMATG